jgi:diguanylate cyclase (GGDEF)-like protein/PAS domain S-box-containing protein
LSRAAAPDPLLDPAEGWRRSARSALHCLFVGLGCLVAVQLGSAVQAGWWAAVALAGGTGLATFLRWGRHCVLGALAGTLVGLVGLGLPALHALWAAGVLTALQLAAHAALYHLGFDTRLERARDVALLGVVTVCSAALPGAALLSGIAAEEFGPAFLQGALTLALAMPAAALVVLTVDRRVLHQMQPAAPWTETGLALVALATMTLLLWTASELPRSVRAWTLFLPHVLVVALALRHHVTLAAVAALLAGLLGAGSDGAGLSLWEAPLDAGAALSAWVGSLLLLLLGSLAAAADARNRAQRWEWALDGSRLGVADWRLGAVEPAFEPGLLAPPVSRAQTGFASAAWRSMTGHVHKRWGPADWLRQVHTEDRAGLEQALQAARAGDAGRQQLELRLPQPGNEDAWRWMEATLLVIERDHDGQPTRLLATLSDVQTRREAQERQLMSASLFQHLHEGLLITDADLRAIDANPAYTQLLGVPRDELLGSVPSMLRPTPADPLARQQRAAMWAGLRDTGFWRGELEERRRDGELRSFQTTISTVYGPLRDLRYHVVVVSDITDQQVQREQLERQAHYDELTRLPNRARLSQLLDDAMRAADRDGYLLVVCYLDLDRFKPVNDRYGHAAGDRLLSELAGRLRSALRSREQWADSAARLGGDEFVLLLRAGTLEEARLAVERVLRVVAQPYVIDAAQDPVQVTASMGATVFPIDRSDADTLLRHADHAMYGAKQSGRNGYLFFDPEHRRRTEERVMAIGRVQEALDKSEFVLFYQPQVDMTSGRVRGFEALLRWDHPQQGLIAPMQFLPLIENTGLSSRVGDWVLSQALEHLSQWRRDGLDITVSVNISARHLQEPDFALRLSELLARHAEPLATHLELEMLETAAHADIEATSALLARCRSIGVRFALDDFGTGYSTLTYLKRLPVDTLKIDRSFVNHMLDDLQDRAIVEGVIGLARTFGCSVVAEGVESPAQARTLLDLGCAVGQGVGIAAPMPAGLVAGWTRDYRGMFTLAPTPPLTALPADGTTGAVAAGPTGSEPRPR